MKIARDIVPIAKFKARVSEAVRGVREHRRPMVITQNGEPAAVLLSAEDYDRLTYEARFLSAVREGLADAQAERTVSDEELGRELDLRLGRLTRRR
jgi:prevent-host-death family protein